MAMRFVFAVFIAMALTITWQTAVLADISGVVPMKCADDAGKPDTKGDKKASGADEPECE
ncbi:MAG: hypothetical protein KDJ27_13550 [Gammaproteobacteria bacterium]|nr:hypothetical protein [Gammaproteobacteria bacterium]MCB1924741.1 hypothetical protein [Gammaproteobacteria bacterium]